MGSKIFLLLGLSIAFVLLISSEVAARDLAETTKKTEGYGGGNYNNGGGYHNGGGNYNNGGGYHNGGGNYNNGGGYHNGGGGYHNGGGGGGYHNGGGGGGYHNGGGGGYHNGGGGGGYHNGGGCYHGYCQYKHRCCNSAAEALENTQVKPQN